jgi:hypothetical protein
MVFALMLGAAVAVHEMGVFAIDDPRAAQK